MLLAVIDDDDDLCEDIEKWSASASKELNLSIEYRRFSDGNALVSSIRSAALNDEKPILLLLDLDFDGDKRAGIKALQAIKTSRKRKIRELPVIIYSNSDNMDEICECYFERANSFVSKGLGREQKTRFTKLISFWANVARTPVTK